MTFPESAMAIGLGAFGHHFEDCEQRFGEFLSVAGAAAYQPTDGSNVPDYLIAAGSFVPGRSPLEPHYPSETWATTLSRISNE
jgi:hypothetical protein